MTHEFCKTKMSFDLAERDVIRTLINHFRHHRDGYDRRGNAIFLSGREPDPAALQVPGVSTAVQEEALELLCKVFEIPRHQMHCLRLSDELMEIYRSFNGARNWDRLEYESLHLSLGTLPGGRIPHEQFLQLRTVEDVVRLISALRIGGG